MQVLLTYSITLLSWLVSIASKYCANIVQILCKYCAIILQILPSSVPVAIKNLFHVFFKRGFNSNFSWILKYFWYYFAGYLYICEYLIILCNITVNLRVAHSVNNRISWDWAVPSSEGLELCWIESFGLKNLLCKKNHGLKKFC